eukprot:272783_1
MSVCYEFNAPGYYGKLRNRLGAKFVELNKMLDRNSKCLVIRKNEHIHVRESLGLEERPEITEIPDDLDMSSPFDYVDITPPNGRTEADATNEQRPLTIDVPQTPVKQCEPASIHQATDIQQVPSMSTDNRSQSKHTSDCDSDPHTPSQTGDHPEKSTVTSSHTSDCGTETSTPGHTGDHQEATQSLTDDSAFDGSFTVTPKRSDIMPSVDLQSIDSPADKKSEWEEGSRSFSDPETGVGDDPSASSMFADPEQKAYYDDLFGRLSGEMSVGNLTQSPVRARRHEE